MAKILFVLLVIVVVAGLAWSWRRGGRVRTEKREALSAMVSCAHCGLHVPAAEALTQDGHDYCSASHRALGPRQP